MEWSEEDKVAIRKFLNITDGLFLTFTQETVKTLDRLKELEEILNNFQE
jgi:hypothetical protein